MTDDELVAAVVSLPDAQERQAWLAAQPEHFCLATVRALKTRADWVERDDARQALYIGQLAEEVAEALDDDEARGLAVWVQANAHELLAEYESSVEKYESAASLFLAADQPLESARTRIGQISALAYLGKFELAQAQAESAQQVLAAAGDLRAVATIDMNMGNLYARRGQAQQALN